MVKNKKGGSGFKKGVKHSGVAQMEEKVVLRDADAGEHYALVTASLGGCRFKLVLVQHSDDDQQPTLGTTSYIGILRGSMRRQKWKNFVAVKDFVLISKREFQTEGNDKVDILHRYNPEATRKLYKMNQLPSVIDDDGESNDVAATESGLYFDYEGIDEPAATTASAAAAAPAAAASTSVQEQKTEQTWDETFEGI